MDAKLIAGNCADVETECLVVMAVDQGEKQKNEPRLAHRDAALEKAAAELLSTGEVTSKAFEAVMVHHPQGLKAKRLLVINAGKAKKFNADALRKAAGTAVRFLKPKMIKSCVFVPPEIEGGVAEAVRGVVEGAFVGDFDPDTYRSDRKDLRMQDIKIVVAPGADQAGAERALDRARIVGESQNFARELVNEPGNHMTPTILGERARAMCQEVGLKCEALGPDKIKELKMGAFWSVAQGSDEEPRLIVIRYEPAGAPEKPVLGLVGKGVTFDTGGISIKPADGMEKMKYDMAGGAAMLGAMRAIGLLKPRVKVTAIVCATENMPSGKAQKPGDIQIAMSGKSIEIINTDAEGRLVLADGLHYARTLGCTHLLDAATLTGACVIALGAVNAGVFANDEDIYKRFCQALQRSGERFWRLPLDQEYFEQIRSSIADIMNTGGRYGGAINAAMFLKEFVDETPWIHMDIAGLAWMDENKSWIAKGPSGVAVRSLVEFVGGFSA
ncbi:MAG TPA: leucyl aminopeptidase [Candidatus Angelobacter sp.]|nr:leucyl aminopeptidase [Candidatus Angelobacter sp.]